MFIFSNAPPTVRTRAQTWQDVEGILDAKRAKKEREIRRFAAPGIGYGRENQRGRPRPVAVMRDALILRLCGSGHKPGSRATSSIQRAFECIGPVRTQSDPWCSPG